MVHLYSQVSTRNICPEMLCTKDADQYFRLFVCIMPVCRCQCFGSQGIWTIILQIVPRSSLPDASSLIVTGFLVLKYLSFVSSPTVPMIIAYQMQVDMCHMNCVVCHQSGWGR